ncbi:hypothetical protein QTP70_004442 [Hemibagrus guttatus]|uniref:Uncharacterized protein n=1 Tax=Hemibagrus guttatus TaxID=175788 RepID=A0AAE0QHV8_9TELE|nr:hypothetical protein QTP70_004442 [Hemibagrus guttatus]
MRVLNYLDDWLTLAHSKAMAANGARAYEVARPQDQPREVCAFSISENHLPGSVLGFHHDAGMSIFCLGGFHTVSSKCRSARPEPLCRRGAKSPQPHGGGSQRDSFVRQAVPVLAQRRLKPSCRLRLPSWDLSVVLDGLLEAPFEPMESASEKFLTLKAALLLALDSLRRVRDLQALLVASACLEFAPGMSKAILHPRAGYVPKVPRMAGCPVILQAFCLPPHESAEQERLHLLCPVRALKTYVHHSGSWPI